MGRIHCLYKNEKYRLNAAINQSKYDRMEQTCRPDTSQPCLIQVNKLNNLKQRKQTQQ